MINFDNNLSVFLDNKFTEEDVRATSFLFLHFIKAYDQVIFILLCYLM